MAVLTKPKKLREDLASASDTEGGRRGAAASKKLDEYLATEIPGLGDLKRASKKKIADLTQQWGTDYHEGRITERQLQDKLEGLKALDLGSDLIPSNVGEGILEVILGGGAALMKLLKPATKQARALSKVRKTKLSPMERTDAVDDITQEIAEHNRGLVSKQNDELAKLRKEDVERPPTPYSDPILGNDGVLKNQSPALRHRVKFAEEEALRGRDSKEQVTGLREWIENQSELRDRVRLSKELEKSSDYLRSKADVPEAAARARPEVNARDRAVRRRDYDEGPSGTKKSRPKGSLTRDLEEIEQGADSLKKKVKHKPPRKRVHAIEEVNRELGEFGGADLDAKRARIDAAKEDLLESIPEGQLRKGPSSDKPPKFDPTYEADVAELKKARLEFPRKKIYSKETERIAKQAGDKNVSIHDQDLDPYVPPPEADARVKMIKHLEGKDSLSELEAQTLEQLKKDVGGYSKKTSKIDQPASSGGPPLSHEERSLLAKQDEAKSAVSEISEANETLRKKLGLSPEEMKKRLKEMEKPTDFDPTYADEVTKRKKPVAKVRSLAKKREARAQEDMVDEMGPDTRAEYEASASPAGAREFDWGDAPGVAKYDRNPVKDLVKKETEKERRSRLLEGLKDKDKAGKITAKEKSILRDLLKKKESQVDNKLGLKWPGTDELQIKERWEQLAMLDDIGMNIRSIGDVDNADDALQYAERVRDQADKMSVMLSERVGVSDEVLNPLYDTIMDRSYQVSGLVGKQRRGYGNTPLSRKQVSAALQKMEDAFQEMRKLSAKSIMDKVKKPD